MTLFFVRMFFFILSGVVGYLLGSIYNRPLDGIIIGACGASFWILVEMLMRSVSVRGLSSVVFGLLFGIIMAKLLSDILALVPAAEDFHAGMRIVLTLIFSYLGAIIALRGKDEFNLIIPYVRFRRADVKEGVVLLDTSAIIDGRITDVYRTHFLAGRLVVPRFVLHELQRLADSEDDLKRQRGRRGMDILRAMQKESVFDLRVNEEEIPNEHEVDLKLVKLAKMLEARICTTDFNLGRVATIQGIEVLNINELVGAVKPVIFSGEELDINIVKEGKEDNQGVGYLEDGTMVVVSDGRRLTGQKVKVLVTSVLQTQAGRMVFAKLEGR